jgi:hypothetical protein
VTLYLPNPDGTFTTKSGPQLPAGFLPASIASADLTGNGLGDLVITAAASDQVFVFLQIAPGVFGPAVPYAVGVNPSAIALIRVDDDDLPDIVVTDRFSGQVSVLLNQGNGTFLPEQRFRAGTGLYDLTSVNGADAVQSLEGTNGLVAGAFTSNTSTDLVVINSGSDSFSLLAGTGGGFLNPQPALTQFLGSSPTTVVTGHFIQGDPNLDLAVLSAASDTITIEKGDGEGGFTPIFSINAGNQPTGLSVADVTRPGGGGADGIADLLVGNVYGDLLILAGNGDGTFSPYVRADHSVGLAVAQTGGTATFLFSNKGSDTLAYGSATPGAALVANPTVYQDRSNGILAPGAETVVTVAGTQYLLLANSGSNQLLVYALDPQGRPVPASKQTYFTGTDPVSITVTPADNSFTGNGIPDVVVANEGSNDVSVFVGQMTGGVWSLAYRPRQSSGGLGPTSVAIVNVPGASSQDGPALVVSNSESNQVGLLLGRGDGYFVNQNPAGAAALLTGAGPRQVLVGNFDGTGGLDLVTINSFANTVTLITNFLTNPVTKTFSSGGTLPLEAVAIEDSDTSFTDLLVANAGNGVLELLRGGADGFEPAADILRMVPGLSDLALVAAGNELQVYGTQAGSEVALLLETFGRAAAPSFLPPIPGFPGGTELVTNPATVEAAVNRPGVSSAETEITLPGGSILLVAASGLLLGSPNNPNSSPRGAGGGDPNGPDNGNGAGGQGTQQSAKPPGDILLNNLNSEENPKSEEPNPNEESRAPGSDFGFGISDLRAQREDLPAQRATAQDLFWQSLPSAVISEQLSVISEEEEGPVFSSLITDDCSLITAEDALARAVVVVGLWPAWRPARGGFRKPVLDGTMPRSPSLLSGGPA